MRGFKLASSNGALITILRIIVEKSLRRIVSSPATNP
jgi:hypothetical protein